MRVMIIKPYKDKETDRDFDIGDKRTVKRERGLKLIEGGVARLISDDDEVIYEDNLKYTDGEGFSLLKYIAELTSEIEAQSNHIADLESCPTEMSTMAEFAFMPDAQLQAKGKENGVDGRIKDRKTIIELLQQPQDNTL